MLATQLKNSVHAGNLTSIVYRSIPLLFFSMCMLPSLFLSLSLQ